MSKAILKTQQNEESVEKFIDSIVDENQKEDVKQIDKLMQEVTGEKPKMWGTAIIGYGLDHLKYASGRELDWMKIGFSQRKGNISLYILRGGEENYSDLLKNLGKFKTGKGCLYIKKLSDVDPKIIKKIIVRSLIQKH